MNFIHDNRNISRANANMVNAMESYIRETISPADSAGSNKYLLVNVNKGRNAECGMFTPDEHNGKL